MNNDFVKIFKVIIKKHYVCSVIWYTKKKSWVYFITTAEAQSHCYERTQTSRYISDVHIYIYYINNEKKIISLNFSFLKLKKN